jgi:hypothetical protein
MARTGAIVEVRLSQRFLGPRTSVIPSGIKYQYRPKGTKKWLGDDWWDNN